MSETAKKVLMAVIILIIFVACLVLIVIGQRNVGPGGLGMMMGGLAGLVFLLWLYNRKYK